jgi:hypothetical protein
VAAPPVVDAAAAGGAPTRPDLRQLALDLPHVVGLGLEDFLPAPCNAAALGAVLRWPTGPRPRWC